MQEGLIIAGIILGIMIKAVSKGICGTSGCVYGYKHTDTIKYKPYI